jgi:hypothetical protein
MTMPQPEMIPVPAPLQWGTATAQTPDGTRLAVVQIAQGQLAVTLQILPQDLRRMAADFAAAARQADSALILPTGPILNGHGH